jgi:hypothetical protein
MKIFTKLWHLSKWRETITCASGIANKNTWNFKQPVKISTK